MVKAAQKLQRPLQQEEFACWNTVIAVSNAQCSTFSLFFFSISSGEEQDHAHSCAAHIKVL